MIRTLWRFVVSKIGQIKKSKKKPSLIRRYLEQEVSARKVYDLETVSIEEARKLFKTWQPSTYTLKKYVELVEGWGTNKQYMHLVDEAGESLENIIKEFFGDDFFEQDQKLETIGSHSSCNGAHPPWLVDEAGESLENITKEFFGDDFFEQDQKLETIGSHSSCNGAHPPWLVDEAGESLENITKEFFGDDFFEQDQKLETIGSHSSCNGAHPPCPQSECCWRCKIYVNRGGSDSNHGAVLLTMSIELKSPTNGYSQWSIFSCPCASHHSSELLRNNSQAHECHIDGCWFKKYTVEQVKNNVLNSYRQQFLENLKHIPEIKKLFEEGNEKLLYLVPHPTSPNDFALAPFKQKQKFIYLKSNIWEERKYFNGSVAFAFKDLDDSENQHINILKTRLATLGLSPLSTPKDGNCFLHAVQQVTKTTYEADELRGKLIHTVMNLYEDRKIEDSSFEPTYSKWIEKMSIDGAWCDHIMVLAASVFYKRPILIVSSSPAIVENRMVPPREDWNTYLPTDRCTTEIVVGHYHELHYVGTEANSSGVSGGNGRGEEAGGKGGGPDVDGGPAANQAPFGGKEGGPDVNGGPAANATNRAPFGGKGGGPDVDGSPAANQALFDFSKMDLSADDLLSKLLSRTLRHADFMSPGFAKLPRRFLELSGQENPPRDLLCRAAALGSAWSVQVLMKFAKSSCNPNDKSTFMHEDDADTVGWSPLHIACHHGYHDVIDALMPHMQAKTLALRCGKLMKNAFQLAKDDPGSRSLLSTFVGQDEEDDHEQEHGQEQEQESASSLSLAVAPAPRGGGAACHIQGKTVFRSSSVIVVPPERSGDNPPDDIERDASNSSSGDGPKRKDSSTSGGGSTSSRNSNHNHNDDPIALGKKKSIGGSESGASCSSGNMNNGGNVSKPPRQYGQVIQMLIRQLFLPMCFMLGTILLVSSTLLFFTTAFRMKAFAVVPSTVDSKNHVELDKQVPIETILQVFSEHDKNNDELIQYSEIPSQYKADHGVPLGNQIRNMTEVFYEADVNGDGVVNFQEFLNSTTIVSYDQGPHATAGHEHPHQERKLLVALTHNANETNTRRRTDNVERCP
eukprot:g1907.t1